MGAKQSKRSVDISGKEAESAGEVAAAGAGGEGRVEQLADADALKPQLNGDAHIHEKSENEKELDSGTPENEKDATTEKEAKASEEEKDREPVANGEPEQKADNGDTAPTPEEGKKPKKEKVKKKFSLRSISFSRKDKPKQEKKRKDEEPKTNGEPEKVPEETAEATTPAVVVNDVPEDKTEIETKEKTPETPVTEPITNGSSTPESLKVESENSIKASLENDKPEPKPEQEPEKLDLNGLSLEEHKIETSDVENKIAEIVEIKNEEQAVEKTPEIAPSPENPVKEEPMPICDKMADLIPEIPAVPELQTETLQETSTDVTVAN